MQLPYSFSPENLGSSKSQNGSQPPRSIMEEPILLSAVPYPLLAIAFSAQKVFVMQDKVKFWFSINFFMTHL